MLERTTTPSMRLPQTECGSSNEIAAPFEIRTSPFPISGAAILAHIDVQDPIGWCLECAIGRWSYESTDFDAIQLGHLTVPVYCFYFTNAVDMKMFSQAYELQMKLALEVLEA